MTDRRRRPALRVPKTIVFIGLMGAGKSHIGRKVAARLRLPFVDADAEIEAAAGCTVEEIFARHGEAAFRDGERRVISRLLDGPVQVLATGGGAYMDPRTREKIRERGVAVWLRADLEVLLGRVARRDNRPLLKQGNPREVLERLIAERHPVYAEAEVIVDTANGPPAVIVNKAVAALGDYFAGAGDGGAARREARA